MNFYLKKYGFRSPFIIDSPHPNLGIVVVIPCFDEDLLIDALSTLKQSKQPVAAVEVIVVINSGEHHPEALKAKNRETYEACLLWSKENSSEQLTFYVLLEENLPKKHAGVGLARKIGMDEAVNRFETIERDGVIVCFDADALCAENYLFEIEKHFKLNPNSPGCSIHYEHPIHGTDFPEEIYTGIINYELHLRYYNCGLKFAGLPYAFHTVGSSMAVRSSAYQKQGGMNKRKAGEDFYFIHKIIALGNFTELKATRVIPSPRISDRVPFGTGKAIGDWVTRESKTFFTYNFQGFVIIKAFVGVIPKLFKQNLVEIELKVNDEGLSLLHSFLKEQSFEKALLEIRANSKTSAAFIKRFYTWFDAFKVLKLMHYLRDNGLNNEELSAAVNQLTAAYGFDAIFDSINEQLHFYRTFELK
ncbi:glycosyltransferase family 2 protein [Crocinitomix sp.]|nr:glycosyltransferase family 2 protein [Crocinitomix sp.]